MTTSAALGSTDYGVADAEDFAECEDEPLLAVQTQQHPGCARPFGLLDEERHIDRYALGVGQVQIGGVVDGLA